MKIKDQVIVTIECDAIGKGRPKFSTVGGYPKAYTPKKTKQQEELIKYEFIRQAGPNYTNRECPVYVSIEVGYRIPKSTSKKKTAEMLENYDIVLKKPDLDNVVKLILDALNGIAYRDDSQIIALDATKAWMVVPQTTITIVYYE